MRVHLQEYVKEAVEMVLKAATITPQIRYVGWDVATTPTGPAIIEGNTYCAHYFWQLPPHTPDGIGMLPKIKEYIPEFFEGKSSELKDKSYLKPPPTLVSREVSFCLQNDGGGGA